jgi:HTH-type transcriptional regulator/antitoxin HigA
VWFSFFHEAGHVLLHRKKQVFVDEDGGDKSEVEDEANRFARDLLLPPAAFTQFTRAGDFSLAAVKRFASEIGVAPGIVVGRMQHDKLLPYSAHHELKERTSWTD